MARVIGADLGTTNSAIAVLEDDEPTIIPNTEGVRATPSVVASSKTSKVLVGEIAKRQAVMNVDRTISSVKRHMGTDWTTEINGKKYTAQEISAHILMKLKADAGTYLGEPVTKVVITIPAYLNDAQCRAIKDAGQIAGLKIEHIVNEPTTATPAYGLEKGKEGELILVSNLDGGTFDVSLLEVDKDDDNFSTIQMCATSGDNNLGGDDWGQRTVNWLIDRIKARTDADLSEDAVAFQCLKEAAEQTKKELSSATSANTSLQYLSMAADGPIHLDESLAHTKFEELTSDLLERTKEPFHDVMAEVGVTVSGIDHVVLVGDSTRMPAVTEVIKELTGGREPNKDVNPDEVIAVGAALQAGVIQGDRKDVLLVDVTPLSLGIETKGGIMTRFIDCNTAILAKVSEIFSATEDNQFSVFIQVYRGERKFIRDNKLLGTFGLSDIAPAPRDAPQIEVTFDINANGIAHVSAKDRGTGKEQSVTITGDSSLSKEEINRMVHKAEEYTAKGKKHREKADIRNQAEQVAYAMERLLKDKTGRISEETREAVRKDVDAVKEALKGNDTEAVKTATTTLSESGMEIGQEIYAKQQTDEAGAQSALAQNDVVGAEIIGEDNK